MIKTKIAKCGVASALPSVCVYAGTYGGSSDRDDLSVFILIPVPSGVGAQHVK